MQTERVTFLTTPDHKAALDAYAKESGMSVGHVVREATSRYIAEGEADDEEAMSLALDELERALPLWRAKLASIERSVDEARQAIQASVAAAGAAR